MKLETFFEKFDQFADAPDALESIRRLILDSAVRGTLVEQDPSDEPASTLLERIRNERDHLERKGALRKGVPLAPIDVIPYEIPNGWEWTRLGNTGRIFNGTSVSESGKLVLSKVAEGYPFIATKDVGYGRDRLSYENGLKVPFDASGYKVARAEAVLICAEGGSAGKKVGQTDRDICFGNKLYANEVWPGIDPRYILSLYQTTEFFKQFAAKMTGIIGGIARSEFLLLPIPLPPLAEQKRIVAKVDKLMTLCDLLETQQQERDTRHAALARASLARFTEAPTPANLDFVFHNSYTIPPTDLRTTILNLAVQGKLVPQDANDEPVEQMLLRILDEQRRLGQTSSAALRFCDPSETLGLDIPEGWRYQKLEHILVFGPTNGFSPKAAEYETPVRSLTLSATTSGRFKPEHSKFITNDIPIESNLWLRDGDILVQRGNSLEYVGVSAIYRGEANRFIYPDLMMKLRVSSEIDEGFIHLAMSCGPSRDFLRARASGTSGTMPKINQATLKSLPLPIPCLAEQRRIVAKVDQLMALVDQLETQLTASRATAEKLMEAVVAELTSKD